jgi:thiaminase/transcriptional activator TenA
VENLASGPGGWLIQGAGELWRAGTTARFLDAAAAGQLPAEAFRRWLVQDYLFAKGLMAYQALTLAKAPRDCHGPLVSGLGALDNELNWFEGHAARLGLDLEAEPLPACRAYTDFLMRAATSQALPVLLAILFGVEASYLAAWSALRPEGPYAEFIERWSTPAFSAYVASLGRLVDRYRHESSQAFFNRVLEHERDFWTMAWEG